MTTQVHPTKHFHLTLEAQGENEDTLQQKLESAGIKVKTVRAVSDVYEGISVTQLLAQGEWDHSTGAGACGGHCSLQTEQHLPYDRMSEAQIEEFHRDMAGGMNHYRADLYDVNESVLSQKFYGVALNGCGE